MANLPLIIAANRPVRQQQIAGEARAPSNLDLTTCPTKRLELSFDRLLFWFASDTIYIIRELFCKELHVLQLAVNVVIGEQRGQGIKVGCRCFWDSDTDNYAQHLYMNESMFCLATAFGVFFYWDVEKFCNQRSAGWLRPIWYLEIEESTRT